MEFEWITYVSLWLVFCLLLLLLLLLADIVHSAALLPLASLPGWFYTSNSLANSVYLQSSFYIYRTLSPKAPSPSDDDDEWQWQQTET